MNRKEIKELLESLASNLRTDIETAQASLKEARSVTTKINNLFTKSSQLVAKLEDPENGLNAKLEQANLDTTKLGEVAASAEKALSDINTDLTTVQQNITAMQTAYTEFQATKTKIDDPTTGLEALLAQCSQYLAQVRASSAEAAQLTTLIKQNLTTVQQNITAMQTAYTEFQATKTKIDDPTTGLEATLDSSQETKAEIDAIKVESETVYKEISRYKDSAAKNIASIEAIKAESDKALEAINTNQTESESLKSKISAIFELVSQSGHANYFDKRAKALTKASWAWLIAAIIFITIAVCLAVHIIVPLTSVDHNGASTTLQELVVRFSVITPFLLLGIFAASNYTKERRLVEHYAFRAVTALSIEGSLLLLNRALVNLSCDDKDKQIISFAVSTMKLMYSEPKEHNKNTKFHLKGANKIVEVGTELNQTIGGLTEAITTKDSKTAQ